MNKLDLLMVGTGEYTTGYVPGASAASDKKAGIVGLTMFDLRRQGLVRRLLLAGTQGRKMPAIRQHLQQAIGGSYRDMQLDLECYPQDDVALDQNAYRQAIQSLRPGSAMVIFTPDDTHFEIAMQGIQHGLHVLIAKPMTKTLDEHLQLALAAREKGVLVAMEVHKRWDPIYADARARIQHLGPFSFFQSYMSQPKSQLETFRAWAGRASDISYYLNAHHIDFHVWSCASFARPIRVRASAANGYARSIGIPTEDTISLLVDWQNIPTDGQNIRSGHVSDQSNHPGSGLDHDQTTSYGTAVYTASWIAPKSDVHSQQRFFYMGQSGEISVDQAHRGYNTASDTTGYSSPNPLFMKYAANHLGQFAGQGSYGYRSIEDFVLAADTIRRGQATADSFRGQLATAQDTLQVTAILEAGRQSLDHNGQAIAIEYGRDPFDISISTPSL